MDLHQFLHDARSMVIGRLAKTPLKIENLKVNVVLAYTFRRMKIDEIVEETKLFNTRNKPTLASTDVNEWFTENVEAKLLVEVEDFRGKESGWSLSEIINLTINMIAFQHTVCSGNNAGVGEIGKYFLRMRIPQLLTCPYAVTIHFVFL